MERYLVSSEIIDNLDSVRMVDVELVRQATIVDVITEAAMYGIDWFTAAQAESFAANMAVVRPINYGKFKRPVLVHRDDLYPMGTLFAFTHR